MRAPLADLGDEGTAVLAKLMTEAIAQRAAAEVDLVEIEKLLRRAERRLARARAIVLRWFLARWIPEREAAVDAARADREEALRRIDAAVVDVDFDVPSESTDAYAAVVAAFRAMAGAAAVWDVTSSADVDQQRTRSSVSAAVTRRRVTFGTVELPMLRSAQPALRFENANGEDVCLFPGVAVVGRPPASFAVIDVRKLSLVSEQALFIEQETPPTDAQLVEHTWERVNKNGQPDRRFKDNRQLPVMRYGSLELRSESGLREAYLVSASERVEAFSRAFQTYQSRLPALVAQPR